jgi:hypothetical protein
MRRGEGRVRLPAVVTTYDGNAEAKKLLNHHEGP